MLVPFTCHSTGPGHYSLYTQNCIHRPRHRYLYTQTCIHRARHYSLYTLTCRHWSSSFFIHWYVCVICMSVARLSFCTVDDGNNNTGKKTVQNRCEKNIQTPLVSRKLSVSWSLPLKLKTEVAVWTNMFYTCIIASVPKTIINTFIVHNKCW